MSKEIKDIDLSETIEHDGSTGWGNGAGKVRHLECTGSVILNEIQSMPGETIDYEGGPMWYKMNGIYGYIVVECTGDCLFFYVYDGRLMYDKLGNLEIKKQ